LLGLYACALLRERGVEHVLCIDIQEQRLKQVHRFGGVAVDGHPEHYPKSREKIIAVAERGVDAVLEVAGTATLVPEGIRLLRPGGYYGFVGMVHPQTQLDLTGEQVIRKCLTIYGIHNYSPWHLDQAVQFLEQTAHKYPYESLVSPPFSLTDLESAIQMAQTQQWGRVSVRALE
jgi:threonine dehydrogenase-like Zn-dependent dehydrogenase